MANDPRRPTPCYPLLPCGLLNSEAEIRDALNNSVAVLCLLADLFGGDTDKYPILESEQARRGMWLQLHSIADLLDTIEKLLACQKFEPEN